MFQSNSRELLQKEKKLNKNTTKKTLKIDHQYRTQMNFGNRINSMSSKAHTKNITQVSILSKKNSCPNIQLPLLIPFKFSEITRNESQKLKKKLTFYDGIRAKRYFKIRDLWNNEIEGKRLLSHSEIQMIQDRILNFTYKLNPVHQLFDKVINELNLNESNSIHFYTNSIDKYVPLKLKFIGIKNSKIRIFTHYSIKRPSRNGCIDSFEVVSDKCLINIFVGVKAKKKFSFEKIYITFEGTIKCSVWVGY